MLFKRFFIVISYVYCAFVIGLKQHTLRITKGTAVEIEKYNYFVQIVQFAGLTFCGGAIINKDAVLTIEYCCRPEAEELTVIAGSVDLKYGDKYTPSEKIIKNPDDTETNDICILKMKSAFPLSEQVGIITLPKKKDPFPSQQLGSIVGFGKQRKSDGLSTLLRTAEVVIYDQPECTKFITGIRETVICAKSKKDGWDVCDGDYGDPLVFDGVLIGLARKKVQCGKEGQYSQYTKVQKFRDWIDQKADTKNRMVSDEESHCVMLENGWFNWIQNSIDWSLELCTVDKCDETISETTKISTNTSCVLNPIENNILITSVSCISQHADVRSLKDSQNLRVVLNNKTYTIKDIKTGSQLLPYFTNSKYDIVLIQVTGVLELINYFLPFAMFSVFQTTFPKQGIVIKHTLISGSIMLSAVAVDVISDSNCFSTVPLNIPFKIIPEIFCIKYVCEYPVTTKGICSVKHGAPIFDLSNNLLGIVIWQDKCQKHQISVALRVTQFIETYRELIKTSL